VRKLRFALLAVVVLAIGAVVAVTFLTRDEHASSAGTLPSGKLLAATATVYPQTFLFADPVHIRVDAVVDRRRLDPNLVRIETNWSPYTPIAPMVRTRTDVGSYARLRWTVDVHCVVVVCVPAVGSNVRKVFEPTTITYAGHLASGVKPQATVTWPDLVAWSRLDPVDTQQKALVEKGPVLKRQEVAFGPPWHVDTTLAAVSYRVSPATVFWAALSLALALVLATAFLLRPYLPGLDWLLPRKREQSALERALEAVERARGATTEERKALELLAAELRESGADQLAWTATELAWDKPVPEPKRTDALTANVRRELAGRTNGRRR
jgi:hypothetical protein